MTVKISEVKIFWIMWSDVGYIADTRSEL